MASVDTIGNVLTKIRNASQTYKEQVEVPYSKIVYDLLRIIQKEGYIKNFKRVEDKKQGTVKIYLKYINKERAITGLKRMSSPGLRMYRNTTKIPKVLEGYGIAILSTNRGILTDKEARAQNVGGEVICYVW
jgi:small subunit ribosomal protein S8